MSEDSLEYRKVAYRVGDPADEARAKEEIELLESLGWREVFDDVVDVPTESDDYSVDDPWLGTAVREVHLYRADGDAGVREPRRPRPADYGEGAEREP
jgi:hypothetical protein